MVAKKEDRELAALLKKVRSLPPMTEKERREQAASFAFGNLALTSQWRDKSEAELDKLRELCRKIAGCS